MVWREAASCLSSIQSVKFGRLVCTIQYQKFKSNQLFNFIPPMRDILCLPIVQIIGKGRELEQKDFRAANFALREPVMEHKRGRCAAQPTQHRGWPWPRRSNQIASVCKLHNRATVNCLVLF